MLFTIVVMAYERPAGLRRCLSALTRLRTDQASFRVVVVDDGSKADIRSVAEEFANDLSLLYRRIPHAGVARARNAGLEESTGDFVAFLADDHEPPPDYLDRAIAFFERVPAADLITFNVRSRGGTVSRHVQQMYMELTLVMNARAHPDEYGVYESFHLPASRAAVFRRSLFDRVAPFDESLMSGEDGELGARLADMGIPVYFDRDFYIDHWEEKSLRDFLRQRVNYAISFHDVLSRRNPPARGEIRWSLARCAREVLGRVRPWARLSREAGWTTRFVVTFPGLLLFLSVFYGTMWRQDRAQAREALRGIARPER